MATKRQNIKIVPKVKYGKTKPPKKGDDSDMWGNTVQTWNKLMKILKSQWKTTKAGARQIYKLGGGKP